MNEEDVFPQEEIKREAEQLVRIIAEYSPARDEDAYPREIKVRGRVISPRPGNLRDNGNVIAETANGCIVKHGYRPAPYALYANKTSRKPGYIGKAVNKFRSFLEAEGWEEE